MGQEESEHLGEAPEFVRLDGGGLTLVYSLASGGAPDLLYLGRQLQAEENLAALLVAASPGRHESQPDIRPVPGLLPQHGDGWHGQPAVVASGSDGRIQSAFRLVKWHSEQDAIAFEFEDRSANLTLQILWEIQANGVLQTSARITNHSDQTVKLEHLASLAMPLPKRFTELTSFSGRWASEMGEHRRTISPDGFSRKSGAGKPGFGGGNWLIFHDLVSGEALAAHLAWSGDHDTSVICDNQGASDGRAHLQMATWWDDGEVQLAPGESFEAPPALLALADSEDKLPQVLHTHLRSSLTPPSRIKGPRKVHLNSWEALSFDLSEEALKRLADDAASLGVERFVLDDGWFGGRRSDRSSLGDWQPSAHIGLANVVEHVKALGMDFGIWVEPEMISPDSDLYRAHPDWCLHVEGRDKGTMRNQLVLDLTRDEVLDYLIERFDALLSEHDIAYFKWDHNRDLFPSAGKRFAQTRALYDLLDRLQHRHPELEIEACASGGGRIDYGILARTHRVWPSDNNDPIERVRIMQAWSRFIPLEVQGNHVGPSPNPITGRRTEMDFRAKIALFGHMGVEADPGGMNEDERALLCAHIALYKDWRDVLHSGDFYRLTHPDAGIFAHMVVGEVRSLAVAAQTAFASEFDAAPVRLKGLEPNTQYRVTLPLPWPAKAAQYLPNKRKWRDGFMISGRALMTQGLSLPLTHPETAWLIAVEKLDA